MLTYQYSEMRRRVNSRVFDPFDEWLESQGLYRKQVARDGSCLFRAVAEQVYMTQTEHASLRSQCLEYMMMHKEEFQPYLEVPVDHHVYKLQDVKEWGGHTEIIAMARLFKVDFLIYQTIGSPPTKATEYNYPKTLMLSFTQGNHYDIVYKKEAAVTRGFCQSLVYEILYCNVFQLKDVRLAVDTMLHDKEYASIRRDSANSAELKEIGALVEKILGTSISRDNSQEEADKGAGAEERPSIEDIHQDDVRGLLAHGIPPFPYKVAKSLDPDIYRNIEYDAWNTIRREARYGPIDYNGFQAGVKVLIKLDMLPNREEVEAMRRAHMARQGYGDGVERKGAEEKIITYQGHIQEMSENKGPVDVYIEEIGRRLKVPYESLERVPPSPPRSPWHQQPSGGPGGGPGGAGSSVSNYKKLSGYYQKAPLPPEPDYWKSKKKGGKQIRESPVNNCGMRGRSASSPTPPRPRTPQGPPHQSPYSAKSYPQRGMARNSSGGYRGAPSPAREPFPPFTPSGMNMDMGVEGVWAIRGNNPPVNIHSGAPKGTLPFPPMPHTPLTRPPPPYGDKDAQVHVREVTMEALQQVMSAGGQQVRVTGQQLEVVPVEKPEEIHVASAVKETALADCTAPTAQVEEEVNGTPVTSEAEISEISVKPKDVPPPSSLPLSEVDNSLQMDPLKQTPTSQEPNGEVPQPLVYSADPSIAFISQPPPLHVPPPQLGDSPSPQTATMYTVTYPPPYSSPGLIQVYSPVPPGDGSCTPAEYNTPPPQPLSLPPTTSTATATSLPLRPEAWDANVQGGDPEAVKMNPGVPPYMVYPMPMVYGGFGGYGYNPQWGYSVPVMPSPSTIEEGKQTPIMPGTDGYQQIMAVSSWGQGYMGDVPPHSVLCPPPAQGYPPVLREPSPLPYTPLSIQQQQQPEGREGGRDIPPFHHQHHHPRGRGRGGPHHRGGHHNAHHNSFHTPAAHLGNFYRGGGGTQRSLPPRFHRGGGGPPGRGGPRHFHNNHTPPHIHHQRSHQYEGQPLMQMGTKKPMSDSLASQKGVAGGMGPAVVPVSVASPPMVTFVDPERSPGVLPLPPPDAQAMPPQEPMSVPPPGYYSAPPGYVMTGPWMWKMM
ncbi:uncharacterized protein LOC127004666 isoform X3 [Eriocheir sinensis]|uniref:uncharacterized protein LOC127004666 isoform X3 n=1 Tax=Eriocheir sinensis TaxID=95602 RepID=UPI0021C78408|nr:uncharacterized protein LOC127004666 isoform X3 [Eriocheir sinensis]